MFEALASLDPPTFASCQEMYRYRPTQDNAKHPRASTQILPACLFRNTEIHFTPRPDEPQAFHEVPDPEGASVIPATSSRPLPTLGPSELQCELTWDGRTDGQYRYIQLESSMYIRQSRTIAHHADRHLSYLASGLR